MKEIAEILVPHKKLTGLYILVLALLGGIWTLDLTKVNVPLSIGLETWFLDKLLVTLAVLLILYSLSAYLLSADMRKLLSKLSTIEQESNNFSQQLDKTIREHKNEKAKLTQQYQECLDRITAEYKQEIADMQKQVNLAELRVKTLAKPVKDVSVKWNGFT